jgi:hypothetical protein
MNASLQTLVALAVVAVAAGLLVWHFFIRKKPPGCAGNCGAVSPELRKLQAKLKRH